MALSAVERPSSDLKEQVRANNFDLLRLIFALFVLVGHCFSMPGNTPTFIHFGVPGHFFPYNVGYLARTGVLGFFALSGYLVTGSYLMSRNVWSYMWKRIVRIWPAFLVIAILCVFVVGPVSLGDWHTYFSHFNVTKNLIAIATIHVWARNPDAFPHNANHTLNGPTWTLPVEFSAYLLVAILGLTSLLTRRWPVVICWLVLAALDIYTNGHSINDREQLYAMFFGGALVKLYPEALRKPAAFGVYAVLWLIGLPFGFSRAVLDLAWPALIVWIGENRFQLPRLRDDLSYGMYLTAWPVEQLLLAYARLSLPWLTLSTALISAGLAWLSWRFVEKPALRLKSIDPSTFFSRGTSTSRSTAK